MQTSASGIQLFRDSSHADIPCDVVESGVSFRSALSSVDDEVSPERRLMVALLRDSIRSILKYRHARDLHGKRLLAEETRWMLSNDMSWFCAFARVCEVLDLNPQSVRNSLQLVAPVSLRRMRRNVLRAPSSIIITRRISC
jgi:hypothetical protein